MYCEITLNKLLKFPNLIEEIKLNDSINENEHKYNSLIDFKSLNKLKIFNGGINYFLELENIILEKVDIYGDNLTKEIEKKMIEKILEIKSLKEADFNIDKLDNDEIEKIPGENNTITKLILNCDYKRCEFTFYNLLYKFPNLTDLFINSYSFYGDGSLDFEIKENSKSKINRLNLNLKNENNIEIKLFCQSYENLISICINNTQNIKNLTNVFPFFNSGNKIIFKSLSSLAIYSTIPHKISFDIFENLCNNIDYMPNLKNLFLDCYFADIKKDIYEKFIEKILKSKIHSIYLCIENDYNKNKLVKYSLDELKRFYPDINKYYFKNIYIMKLCSKKSFMECCII